MQSPKNINNVFFDKYSFYLLAAWVTMPILILLGQALRLDQTIGNLFLMYITILGMITFVFVSIYTNHVYREKGINFIKQILIKSPWNLALLAMFVWSLLASLLADDIMLAFYGTSYRNDGFFTYCIYTAIYCCAQINKSEWRRKKILQYFVFASLPLCLVTILQYFNYSTDIFGIYYRERLLSNMKYAAIFYNTNHYGYYLTMIITVSAGLYWQSKRTLDQAIFLFVFIINTWCLIINNTFGCYLAVFLLCVSAPHILHKTFAKFKRWKSFMPLLFFILLTFLSSQIVANNLQSLSSDVKNIASENSAAKNAGSKRWELWTNGMDLLKKNPIFGYGPENLEKEYMQRGIKQDRPHNEYLQHALFLGIPALFFYLTSIFLILKNWLKTLNSMSIARLASGLAVIGYLCSAFFGNTMFYTSIYFFCLLGYISKNINIFK
ncbi:MAG: O-antigen ligase family protein [Acidaminococcaceae bacterium]